MPEIDDAELRMLLDATHRGFWGAYAEAFPRILRDLARARGIDVEAANRETDARLRAFPVCHFLWMSKSDGLDFSPEAVLRVLGEDYR